jgi:hypothetical protein
MGVKVIARLAIDIYTNSPPPLYNLFHLLYPFLRKIFLSEYLHHKAPSYFVIGLLKVQLQDYPRKFLHSQLM